MDGTSSEGICVGVRMRPLNEKEIGQQMDWTCESTRVIGKEGEIFVFDKVFDDKSTTADVYAGLGKKIVDFVVSGINGTIFAYGQTSSGKTHTMLGSKDQPGILRIAADDIINQISNNTERSYRLKVSFVEIHNEVIYDLLIGCGNGNFTFNSGRATSATINSNNEQQPAGLEIKDGCVDATEIIIDQVDTIFDALEKGLTRRTMDSTLMNATSSRSHSIFKIVVESWVGEEGEGAKLISALTVVDLVGSESAEVTGAEVESKTHNEGININQSLTTLRLVIDQLSQKAKGKNVHVNFRDSKLTYLLKPSLEGNAKMSLVCCFTSAHDHNYQTKMSLSFASSAKDVKTSAKVNKVLTDGYKLKKLKKLYNEQIKLIVKLKSEETEKDLRLQQLGVSSSSSSSSSSDTTGEVIDFVEPVVDTAPAAPSLSVMLAMTLIELNSLKESHAVVEKNLEAVQAERDSLASRLEEEVGATSSIITQFESHIEELSFNKETLAAAELLVEAMKSDKQETMEAETSQMNDLMAELEPVKTQLTEATSTLATALSVVCARLVKKLVDDVVSGIGTDGQTSSDKTHTMLGSKDQPGILRMAAAALCHELNMEATSSIGINTSSVVAPADESSMMNTSFKRKHASIAHDDDDEDEDQVGDVYEGDVTAASPKEGPSCSSGETPLSDSARDLQALAAVASSVTVTGDGYGEELVSGV